MSEDAPEPRKLHKHPECGKNSRRFWGSLVMIVMKSKQHARAVYLGTIGPLMYWGIRLRLLFYQIITRTHAIMAKPAWDSAKLITLALPFAYLAPIAFNPGVLQTSRYLAQLESAFGFW